MSGEEGGARGFAVAGLGVDLVEIEELERIIARRGTRFLERVFTSEEIAYCREKHRPGEPFGARFAAKEAAFKALGTGWGQGVSWKDVEVHVPRWGAAPTLRFRGGFSRHMSERHITSAQVSLSHTRTTAVAVVLLLMEAS